MNSYSKEVIGKVILDERKKRGWSQAKLAMKLKSMGRGITAKQVSNYENAIQAPPIETLLILCQLFSCELGYLLGEEDYRDGTRLDTAIRQKLGLSKCAVGAIETAIKLDVPQEAEARQRIVNRFFESPCFGVFINSLIEAASISSSIKEKTDEFATKMVQRFGEKEALNVALQYVINGLSPAEDSADPKIQSAVAEFGPIPDEIQGMEFGLKVARYELNRTFEQLVEDIL